MPTVFISGAAGGLGHATTTHLAACGWEVVAGDLPGPRLEALDGHANIRPVPLDVTDAASVKAAADAIPGDGLDAVVTFAGVLAVGSVAELSDDDLARVLDVNVLGTARVVRAMFDRVVARRGRIVLISSETGWQTPAPFNGAYALSKHAVEAYGDALRREAALLGVRVVKIQPGPFRTDMVAGIARAFDAAADSSTHFRPLLRRMGPMAAREQRRASDPAVLAAVIEEALTSPRPKIAYSVRPGRSRVALERLPVRVADALLVAALRRANR